MLARHCQAWQTAELRRAVLRPHADPADPLPGDDVEAAVHVGVFSGEQLVGACVVLPEPCPFRLGEPAWRLRGMAADPGQRNKGVGTLLLRSSYQIVDQAGADLIWCLARETAVGFYQRNGWAHHGTYIEAVGLPHLRMWRSVAGPMRVQIAR